MTLSRFRCLAIYNNASRQFAPRQGIVTWAAENCGKESYSEADRRFLAILKGQSRGDKDQTVRVWIGYDFGRGYTYHKPTLI
jgi:hypothetical protein